MNSPDASNPADHTAALASPAPQDSTTAAAPRPAQPHNPLHGMTLQAIVQALVDYFGWAELGNRISIRCFQSDPSVASSLKFLRKTPWAREKVEQLYLFTLRDQRRQEQWERSQR